MTANRYLCGKTGRFVVSVFFVFACALVEAAATSTAPIHVQTSRGGTTLWHLNDAILGTLGINLTAVTQNLPQRDSSKLSSYRELEFAALDQSGFRFVTSNGLPRSLSSGQLHYAGGFVLEFPGGHVDLRGFELRLHADTPFALDVVDQNGNVWFNLDHGHYLLEDNRHTFALRYMNLRISPYFAAQLKRPDFAGLAIGGMDTLSSVIDTTDTASGVCTAPWPGQQGAQADIKMVYQASDAESGIPDSIHFMRCGLANTAGSYTVNACTPTSTDHVAVFAPDTSLLNIGSAAVPWHKMFSGPFAPYGNDQHPFLVWNLYRKDADGSVRQIAASGAKHAFNTINKTCGCSDSQNNYPTCEDSYSYYSNDIAATQTPNYLGPRSEIIPATGQWGRCASVFDSNCLGRMDANGGAQDDFQYHLIVPESDISATLQPGASYYFEYWYVVRDQVNIYDAMGYRPITFSKDAQSGVWQATPGTFVNGPVINAWVNPTTPPSGTSNQQLNTAEGHARIAVTTTTLGNGLYRYNYAVMNFDFARAVIDPAHPSEPNLHVLSTNGFSAFTVPLSATATITNIAFSDVDDDGSNDWAVTRTASGLAWQASPGHPLNWGTMYRFSFTADRAPLPAAANLDVATSGTPTSYTTGILAPVDDVIFRDGFGAP